MCNVRAGTSGEAFLRAAGASPDPATNDTRRILRLDVAALDRAAALRRASGGQRALMTVRHDASGDLVALSAIGLDAMLPGWGFQGATVVRRDHRGHRLGTLVKAALHQQVAERFAQVRWLMSTNHATNTPMIAVNDRLGFEKRDEFTTFRLPLGDRA